MGINAKNIRITIAEPVRLPEGVIHTGNRIWISKTIDFANPVVYVDNEEDLRDNYFTLDIADDDTLYVKTQYVYNGGPDANPVEGSLSSVSRISSLKGNQEGLTISDTIVETPRISLVTSYANTSAGESIIKGSDFDMYTSIGNHVSSTWIFKDLYNKTIMTVSEDVDRLTEFKLPEEIESLKYYIVELYYHTDTNAISNAGKYFNITENKTSTLFTVEKLNRLVIGRPLYFKIKLRTVKFKSLNIVDKDMNGVVVEEIENTTDLSPSLNTDNYVLGSLYYFEFKIDLGDKYTDTVIITDIASNDVILYDPNKTYSNKNDYKQLISLGGKTSQLSYQLYNESILMVTESNKAIGLFKYVNENLIYVGDIIELPVDMDIELPSLYVNEMSNGDVLVVYTGKDTDNMGEIFMNLYGFNPVTNEFTFKTSKSLGIRESVVRPGAITITWDNTIHYVEYTEDRTPFLTSVNLYTDATSTIEIPIHAGSSVGIVRDMNDNIMIVGGTDVYDTEGDTVPGLRTNDKIYIFNYSNQTFTELGWNIMERVDLAYYSFHPVLQHNSNVVLFNTLDNNNIEAIENQSTIQVDVDVVEVIHYPNDHSDNLPYLCTVVLRNGDVLRISSVIRDPQKVYGYISNTMDEGLMDDNDNVVRNLVELTVKDGEDITVEYVNQYDKVVIEGTGKLNIERKGEITTYDQHSLIITRDTVKYRRGFEAENWKNILLVDAELIIKDEDDEFN